MALLKVTNCVLLRRITSPLSASFTYTRHVAQRGNVSFAQTIEERTFFRRGVAAIATSRSVISGCPLSSFSSRLSFSESSIGCQSFSTTQTRLKGKDKGGKAGKGGKGGKGGGRVRFDDSFSEVVDRDQYQSQMEEIFEKLAEDLAIQCTVKSGVGAFDRLMVNTVDGEFSLNELGTITQKSSSLIVVNMSSLPNYIPDVISAINESNLNVNPQQDGAQITLPIPKITKEHRARLAADAKKRLESMKTDCRRIFGIHCTLAKKKKEAGASEDMVFMVEKWLKQEMDDIIEKGDVLVKEKQAEVLDTSRG